MWKRKEHGWNYKSRIKILSPKSERFKDIFIWIFEKFRAASLAFVCKRWSGKDIRTNMKHPHEMWENHLRLLGPECSDSWDFQAQLNLLPDFLWLCFIVFSNEFPSFLISRIFHFRINSNQGFWLQNCTDEKENSNISHASERWEKGEKWAQ